MELSNHAPALENRAVEREATHASQPVPVRISGFFTTFDGRRRSIRCSNHAKHIKTSPFSSLRMRASKVPNSFRAPFIFERSTSNCTKMITSRISLVPVATRGHESKDIEVSIHNGKRGPLKLQAKRENPKKKRILKYIQYVNIQYVHSIY